MGLLETLGRMADEKLALEREYGRLLALVDRMSRGLANPKDMTVDLVNDSWSYTPGKEPAPSPAEPQGS